MYRRMKQSMTQRQLVPVVVIVGLLLAGVAWWHFTQRPQAMTAAEARPLLSDQTLLGAWGSATRRYALYLAPDGSVAYREEERPVTGGSWRLEPDGSLCLTLEGIATACYGVGREGADLVWILPGGNRTYPFTTQPGRIAGL